MIGTFRTLRSWISVREVQVEGIKKFEAKLHNFRGIEHFSRVPLRPSRHVALSALVFAVDRTDNPPAHVTYSCPIRKVRGVNTTKTINEIVLRGWERPRSVISSLGWGLSGCRIMFPIR